MRPYIPEDLPINGLNYKNLISLVGEANSKLSEYNGLLHGLINPTILLSPLADQEAVLSSKIEGTQATVEEVLKHEAGEIQTESKTKDIQEILNYRKALILGSEQLKTGSIKLNLIRKIHKVLMTSVRGGDKTPGAFRKIQNWIGRDGCKIEDASFIPPHPIKLIDCLENLEKYLKYNDFDPIVQTAIVHAQFELIHPFVDGNGRVGRLLIPMFLYIKKRLKAPAFYMSYYLEKNRDEYYKRLKNISAKKDWDGWIIFFLNAVIEQAKIDNNKLTKIIELYNSMKEKIRDITHSQYSLQLLDFLFNKPIFSTVNVINDTKIPKPSVHLLVKQLKEKEIILTIREGKGKRSHIFIFPQLLDIIKL